MTPQELISLCVFLPLLAAFCVGTTVRIIPVRLAQFITCGGVILAALAAVSLFSSFTGHHGGEAMVYKVRLANWITSGDFQANWVLRVDSLTALMLVVVTVVSAVVHVYSVGYMSHDEHQQRFMAYLSLFTFCMLMLVTADNFVQMFFGWEGVGLSSYLLIGFWHHKQTANAAAVKAFLVNRVGDIGFALGIFACYAVFGSVSFDTVFMQVADKTNATLHVFGHEFHALTIVCVLLFIGAMGKSAQLGLHTWLPDAMEGPTPVSALIHAATMVTAGVFMVVRCSPIFSHAPDALLIVTIVGALTALFAATIGLVQTDIKRVIAYSTCSQLGYMFMACGVGAYSAAMFHLATHAFFKALLFLGAGSVIHAYSGEQDLRRMGGSMKLLPWTHALMWLGSLALAGIPPFAGYFSKDLIIESTFAAGNVAGMFAFVLACLAAWMTAFYSWRLLILAFNGKSRADAKVQSHLHESPRVMLLPLIVLALGAVFAGYVGAHMLGIAGESTTYWQGIIVTAHGEAHPPVWAQILPLFLAISGIATAYLLYGDGRNLAARFAQQFRGMYQVLLNKYYIDELYDAVFVRPAHKLGVLLWRGGDERVVDAYGPNGAAAASQYGARMLSRLQSGFVYHYALAMFMGFLILISWMVWYGL